MSLLDEIKELQEKFEGLFERDVNGTMRELVDKQVHAKTPTEEKEAAKNYLSVSKAITRNDKKQLKPLKKEYIKADRAETEAAKKSEEEVSPEEYNNIHQKRQAAAQKYFTKKSNIEDAQANHKYYAQEIKKMNDNNSLDVLSQVLELQEAFDNLFEARDQKGGAQKEVNKITRTKKDKNGEPVEVVSVADELFPYKGTAKEQYNQKIIAKINDMIEGTATLEDLIQLVRQKQAAPVKESLKETLAKMEAVLETVKDDVSYSYKGKDGAVFTYKGNRYTYEPEYGENRFEGRKMTLKKIGEAPDYRGPITKAVADANQNFDNSRSEKYSSKRIVKKANEKLNKLVKEFEKKNGKNSFPGKTTPEIEQALSTVKNAQNTALEADKKFSKVNDEQKKDGGTGLVGGLKYEDSDMYRTKKGDSFGFKPVVKKS